MASKSPGNRFLILLDGVAEHDSSFEGFQADSAGNTFSDMSFDILTGQLIQFLIQILGQFFKLGKTLVGMMGVIGHDRNNPSVFSGQTAWPGEA